MLTIIHHCEKCDEQFSEPVWHCDNCAHHWLMHITICHNCYEERKTTSADTFPIDLDKC